MIEPFIWMLKHKDFKKHFGYLLGILLKFFIPAIILTVLFFVFHNNFSFDIQFLFLALIILLYIAPFLCLQGYLWELAGNIISRDWDIEANSVYNGKIKQVYKIELPELRTFKLVWRGIASVVANILMSVPLLLLVLSSSILNIIGCTYFGTAMYENPSYIIAMFGAFFIYWFLVPAFLWNYANRDSVVAVWNLRKAIYISGNYTGKYILNGTVFCFFNSFFSAVTSAIFSLIFIFPGITHDIMNNYLAFGILVLSSILVYLIYIYCVYVDAYLLGTIAPPHEG